MPRDPGRLDRHVHPEPVGPHDRPDALLAGGRDDERVDALGRRASRPRGVEPRAGGAEQARSGDRGQADRAGADHRGRVARAYPPVSTPTLMAASASAPFTTPLKVTPGPIGSGSITVACPATADMLRAGVAVTPTVASRNLVRTEVLSGTVSVVVWVRRACVPWRLRHAARIRAHSSEAAAACKRSAEGPGTGFGRTSVPRAAGPEVSRTQTGDAGPCAHDDADVRPLPAPSPRRHIRRAVGGGPRAAAMGGARHCPGRRVASLRPPMRRRSAR